MPSWTCVSAKSAAEFRAAKIVFTIGINDSLRKPVTWP